MHDLRLIREQPELFDRALGRRGLEPVSSFILDLDAKRRAAQTVLQAEQSRRGALSKQIGTLKRDGGDADTLLAEVDDVKTRMIALEAEERALSAQLEMRLASLPNLPADDVPDGPDERANVELRRHGTPPHIEAPRDHVAIGEGLGLMDFDTAAKLSGARFVVLRGALSRLERALGQFMLDVHTQEFGYTELSVPLMVRDEAAFGTGQLPKFGEDLFRTTTGHWLIPTAEVSLTNTVLDSILDTEDLPLRLTALTPCFRSEAGAAGKDTRGMIRQHQFWKVELVSITAPDQSLAEHERMTQAAETILRRLGIAYRTIVLSTGDMGFSARKTYDIEAWLPGQNTYREISSCSNCGDFQGRRMKARCRAKGTKDTPQFVHTLNGSGLAVGRTLVAVLENYQQPDGSVVIPEVLLPYMAGLEVIRPHG